MKIRKLLTNLGMASVVLLAGCKSNNEPAPGSVKAAATATNVNKSRGDVAARVQATTVSASGFAVLAGTTLTNDGASHITGDIGVSPGTALTGFQPSPYNVIAGPGTVTGGLGIVDGIIYAGGPVAAQAHTDANVTYNYLVAQVADTTYSGVTQLDGITFTPGIYSFAPSANLQVNGTVYLDFQGNSDALFIFQMGTTLVTMTGSNVIALNNNNATCNGSNVFWAVGSSATIDGNQFVGTVVATTTITMTSGSKVSGRLWALNGAVTMISDSVSVCAGATGTPVPTTKCRDFVTGGGWIHVTSGEKATFGVSGGILRGKLWGQLSFHDQGHHGLKIKSRSVTSYIVIDAFTRQIEGIARINDQGTVNYKVIVVDKGEPGRNDSFSLELSNGYTASGILLGGNIQLHKKCVDKDGEHNGKDDCEDGDEHDHDREPIGNH